MAGTTTITRQAQDKDKTRCSYVCRGTCKKAGHHGFCRFWRSLTTSVRQNLTHYSVDSGYTGPHRVSWLEGLPNFSKCSTKCLALHEYPTFLGAQKRGSLPYFYTSMLQVSYQRSLTRFYKEARNVGDKLLCIWSNYITAAEARADS